MSSEHQVYVERKIPRNHYQIYAHDYPGKDPAFVLMHGFPDNLHIYDYLAPLLARSLGLTVSQAESSLLNHIAVCFDTCHFAVEYEDYAGVVAALQAANVRIGRIQISAGVRANATAAARAELCALDEPVYLHQVVERGGDGALRRFRDLPEACGGRAESHGGEWRVHFHVPLFASRFGELASTSQEIVALLASAPPTSHLEIETYTWNVLPQSLRTGLVDSIEREYRWVLDSLCTKQLS